MNSFEETYNEYKNSIEYYNYKNISIAYNYIKINNNYKNIVFLYGFGSNMIISDLFTKYFTDEYNFLVIDYPGHGFSSPALDLTNPDDISSIINDIVRFLKITDLILIGYSFGGILSLPLLSKIKNITSHFILIHSTYNFSNKLYKKNAFAFVEKLLKLNFDFFIKYILIPMLKDRYFTKDLLSKAKKTVSLNNKKSVIRLYQEIIYKNYENYLDFIDIPTLIIGSEKDPLVPRKDTRTLSKKIKKSKMIIYKKYGHYSIMSNPKQFFTDVDMFIKDHNC